MITADNLYELGLLPAAELLPLQDSFNTLPQDSYVDARLRSRCYSVFKLKNEGTLERQCTKKFMQSKAINKALGDVERQYEEIPEELDHIPAFIKMFEEFKARTHLDPESMIEAHQIRWHCKKNIKIPAPEGVHQDGFDFIGIFMADTNNVDGGEIMLYKAPDNAPFFKKHLDPGEFVILNDKKLFHNAAPLVPTPNDEDGHWDVIVLTANQTMN